MTTQEVFKIYAEDIRRFVFSKVKDIQITNDIVQDAFYKVHIKLSSLQDKNKLKSWLFALTRNCIADHFNNAKKIGLFQVLHEEDEMNIPEHTEKDCLLGIIQKLPKKYRDPLYLYDIKGVKQAQIALQLKLPLSTVKSQIQRGRKKIVAGYMECCDYKLNEAGFLVGEVKDKEHCKVCNSH